MAGEDVDEDVANAIDVDAAADNPAIVDAEAAAPNPPDMDNRQLTDLYKTISASSWSVPVEDSAGLDHCVRDAVEQRQAQLGHDHSASAAVVTFCSIRAVALLA